MSLEIKQRNTLQESLSPTSLWQRRLIISLTLLIWIVLTGVSLWLLGKVSNAVVLLLIGAIIATVIYPLVARLQRFMPRPVAIAIVYTLVFAGVVALFYVVVNTAIDQIRSLIHFVQSQINSNGSYRLDPVLETLRRFGVSQSQLQSFGQRLVGQLQGIVNNAIPFLSNLFDLILNVVLIALLSIYFLLKGPRITHWLRHKTPVSQRGNISFLLDTFGRVIGGNFRGVFFVATIIGTLTWVGLFFLGVPYAFLLAVLAFVLEFIPVIGFYITAIAVVLLAVTQGWVTGVLALGFVLLVQVIEGEFLVPRIIGGAVGINPIVAIAALIAGSQLFGVLGAFLAAPTAGVIQAILVALWSRWKESHPEQFPQEGNDDHKPEQVESSKAAVVPGQST